MGSCRPAVSDLRAEVLEQAKVILRQNSARGTIIWIKGYLAYEIRGDYWLKIFFEPLNKPGDAGELVLRAGAENKYYWLGQDIPGAEVPDSIIYDQRAYIPVNAYAGDETLPVNDRTDKEVLRQDDYSGYSGWALILMRQEIRARHGAAFDDERVKRFFETRTWYRPRNAGNQQRLSTIEKENAEILEGLIANSTGMIITNWEVWGSEFQCAGSIWYLNFGKKNM